MANTFSENTWLKRWQLFLATVKKNSAVLQFPSAWMAYFLHQLNVIGWPGGRGLNSLEHQLVNRWQQLLEEIADLDAVAGTVPSTSLSTAIPAYRENYFSTAKPTSSFHSNIRSFRSSGLFFDKLWIMELNEYNWPTSYHPNPFLPYHLQLKNNMPHSSAQRELVYTQKIMHRLTRSAHQLWLSYFSRR